MVYRVVVNQYLVVNWEFYSTWHMTPPVFDGSSISGDIAVMRDGILLGLPHFLTWHGSKITILPYSNGKHDWGFGEPRRETHSLSILFHLFKKRSRSSSCSHFFQILILNTYSSSAKRWTEDELNYWYIANVQWEY